MRHRSPKRRTYRLKLTNGYITVYLSKIDADIWNIGTIISRSKRRANDWYRARTNKRAQTAYAHAGQKSFKEMALLFRLIKQAIKEVPWGHSIIAYPSTTRNKIIMSYIERLGFIPTQMIDEEFLWVLINPRSQEDLQPS